MKALVYQGPGEKAWQDKPTPKLVQPTDAIVRIDAHDDLRNRSAHPQGRRARGDARTHPRA